MPFSDPAQNFQDILEYIDHIDQVLEGVDLETFSSDRKTSAAIERFLQIVTEAAYRLNDDAEVLCPGPDWRSWRGLGNILRHAYDRVDPALIWVTVQEDIPLLRIAVIKALQRMEASGADQA